MADQDLLIDKHVAYIQSLGKNTDDLAYHMTAHLRLNAIYWGVTALHIMGRPDALDKEEVLDFVLECWNEDAGAFSTCPGHDAHILPTLSAVQLFVTYDALDRLDNGDKRGKIIKYILDRRNSDGSFCGDEFGERDTRFMYTSVSALSLLGARDALDEIREPTSQYIMRCANFDGGFGADLGAESHAAQVWVCLAALVILDKLSLVDVELTAWWLAERQLPGPAGGLNGRPEKLPDVCYSHWVLSSLSILQKLSWVDAKPIERFILSAQDDEGGGIADRAGDMADVFHTIFGVAGLSLLGYPGLVDLDPVYCMPAETIERIGLKKPWAALPRRTSP